MPTPITDIIPHGKRRLIKVLTEAGYTTLEDCAAAGPDKLIKLKGVGVKTIIAIKEHCFQNDLTDWNDSNQDEFMGKLTDHFKSRYGINSLQANLIAKVFYWDNARPTSLSKLMF